MSDVRKAMRVRITGRVQGVNYRAWTRKEAEKLGLTGWVRNEEDGSVAAFIAGPAAAVAAMIGKLRQGPSMAAVSEVAVEDAEGEEIPDRFRIAG